MRVLVLSPHAERLAAAIAEAGDSVLASDLPLDPGMIAAEEIDFVIAHGHRHAIAPDALSLPANRMIKLHLSLLPWNRGSDPNFWSFFNDTPKGVSIHQIGRGTDSGDVLAQALIIFGGGETLASSHARLGDAVWDLFAQTWPAIRRGQQPARPQRGRGSVHRGRDKAPFFAQLGNGWNTPVEDVEALGRRYRQDHSGRGKAGAVAGSTRLSFG